MSGIRSAFGSFVCAGLLRVVSPWGALFYLVDVYRYFPVGLLYAVAMVAVYALQGSYETIRLRSLARETIRVAISSLIGFALAATVLYVFSLSQFSRLLLAYFYLLSVVAIVAKRWVVHKLAQLYARQHDVAPRVLLIGAGQLALRYYENVIAVQKGIKYIGYLAPSPPTACPVISGPSKRWPKYCPNNMLIRLLRPRMCRAQPRCGGWPPWPKATAYG